MNKEEKCFRCQDQEQILYHVPYFTDKFIDKLICYECSMEFQNKVYKLAENFLSRKKFKKKDYLSLIGKKIHDWQVLEWLYRSKKDKDNYLVKCKCGRELCVRWQSFTRNTKCCRICKKKESEYN